MFSAPTRIPWYYSIIQSSATGNRPTSPQSDLVSESLVIFIVATTGSGVEPRTMSPMWNALLRSDLPPDLFEDLSFAVFGLGDSAYEKFCWPAKKLSRRLQNLGGREFCPRAEADDQQTVIQFRRDGVQD